MLLTHGEQEENAITFSYYHIFLMKNIIEEDDGLCFLYLTFDNVTKIHPCDDRAVSIFLNKCCVFSICTCFNFYFDFVLIFTLIY